MTATGGDGARQAGFEAPGALANATQGWSLATRLLLLVGGIVPVIFAAKLTLLREARDTLRAQIRRSGETLAAHFEQFTSDAILSNNWTELGKAVDAADRIDPDLQAIEVRDAKGALVAGHELGPGDPAHEIRVVRDLRAPLDAERVLALGTVTIVYDTARTDRMLAQATVVILASALGLAGVLVGWLLWNLHRQVLRPIRELTAYARALGSGTEPPALQAATKAEFALLAGSLSHARSEIADRDRELREQYETVRAAFLQLEAVLQSVGEGVLCVDDEGLVVLTNGAVEDMLGPLDEILNRRILDILPACVDEKGRTTSFSLPQEGQPPLAGTSRIGRRIVRWSLARVAGSGRGRVRFVAVIRDVTLEVEEAAMKNEFIASVSHELRTPLTSIVAFAEILASAAPGEWDRRKEFVDIIHREAQRMSSLVDDILEISRLEGDAIRFEIRSVELAEVAREAIATLQPVAGSARVSVALDAAPDAPAVAADRKRVVQVFVNLLSNALKFTPPRGRVAVRLRRETDRSAHGDRAWCAVEVEDTGVGISPEDVPRIFEKFTQVGDPLVAKPKGTGLGLSICRRIVERMGGTIGVRSQPGKGSTFSFRLPAWTGAPASAGGRIPSDEGRARVGV